MPSGAAVNINPIMGIYRHHLVINEKVTNRMSEKDEWEGSYTYTQLVPGVLVNKVLAYKECISGSGNQRKWKEVYFNFSYGKIKVQERIRSLELAVWIYCLPFNWDK